MWPGHKLGSIQLLTVTAEAVKVGAEAKQDLNHLDEQKLLLKAMTKHLRGFLWRKMLTIYCGAWH